MKRRVLFHMGAHRTATTLLQIRMRERAQSLAQAGVRYVPPQELLRAKDDVPAALNSFLDRSGQARTFLVVFEDILGPPTTTGDRLYPEARPRLEHLVRALGPDVDLAPMYVVRRYDSYWLSCHRHEVTKGNPVDLSSTMAALERSIPSWRAVVEAIEALVGRPIPVRRYEDLDGLDDDEIVAVFLRMAGLPAEPLLLEGVRRRAAAVTSVSRAILSKRPNASLSERGMLLAEVIRPLVTREEWTRHFRPLLTKHFNRVTEPDTGRFAIPEAIVDRAHRQYELDREWLGHRLSLTSEPPSRGGG